MPTPRLAQILEDMLSEAKAKTTSRRTLGRGRHLARLDRPADRRSNKEHIDQFPKTR